MVNQLIQDPNKTEKKSMKQISETTQNIIKAVIDTIIKNCLPKSIKVSFNQKENEGDEEEDFVNIYAILPEDTKIIDPMWDSLNDLSQTYGETVYYEAYIRGYPDKDHLSREKPYLALDLNITMI